MTGPRQPRTCSQLINARTLTGVCQAVRMFSPCQFHVHQHIQYTLHKLKHANAVKYTISAVNVVGLSH